MPESNRLPCHLLFGLYYPCLTLLPGTDDHAATLWLVYRVLYPLPGIEPMVLNLCLLISYGLLPCGYSLGVSTLLLLSQLWSTGHPTPFVIHAFTVWAYSARCCWRRGTLSIIILVLLCPITALLYPSSMCCLVALR